MTRIKCTSRGEFVKGQYIKRGESVEVSDIQATAYLLSPNWVLVRSHRPNALPKEVPIPKKKKGVKK